MRYLAAPVNQNYTDQNGQVQFHPSDKFDTCTSFPVLHLPVHIQIHRFVHPESSHPRCHPSH